MSAEHFFAKNLGRFCLRWGCSTSGQRHLRKEVSVLPSSYLLYPHFSTWGKLGRMRLSEIGAGMSIVPGGSEEQSIYNSPYTLLFLRWTRPDQTTAPNSKAACRFWSGVSYAPFGQQKLAGNNYQRSESLCFSGHAWQVGQTVPWRYRSPAGRVTLSKQGQNLRSTGFSHNWSIEFVRATT